MGLYDNVKAVCKENGIAVTRLEKDCGLPQSSVRRWNANEPSIGRICRGAEYIGCSIDRLVYGR